MMHRESIARPGQTLTSVLVVVAVIGAFSISSMMLTRAGIVYDLAGGSIFEKIHPATYVAVLALAIDLLHKGRPIGRLADIIIRFPGAVFFVAMWVLLLLYSALVQRVPVAPLIDNYVIALAVLILYDEITPATRELLRRFLHAVMFVNAALGILEFVFHIRLTPYVLAGVEVVGDYRSTALLGHPLANAATTGAYSLCLYLGGDRSLTLTRRLLMLLPQLLAMVAFGGRAAIVMVGGIMALNALKYVALLLFGKKFDMRVAIAALLGLPIVMGVGVAAAYAGVFDQLTGRFVDDNGSALARVILLRLFDLFPIEDILFGPNPDLVTTALSTLGIQIGIESTWFAWLFQYGALMTMFFMTGLLALCWDVWRRARAGAILPFIFFFGVISSSIGLAGKTYVFCYFVIFLVFLFRPQVGVVPQKATRRGPSPEPVGMPYPAGFR